MVIIHMRRWVAGAAALLMLLALLGACRGSGNTGTSGQPANVTSTASPAVSAQPQASPSATRSTATRASGAGAGSPSPVTTARSQASPSASPTRPTGNASRTPTAAPTNETQPTPTPASTQPSTPPKPAQLTPTPTGAVDQPLPGGEYTPEPADTSNLLTVVEQGFGQASGASELGYGFVVKNPRADAAIMSSPYVVTAYDAAGAALETAEGVIDAVSPGQSLGVGGSIYLDASQTATRVEVSVSDGVSQTLDQPLVFTAGKTRYFTGESYPYVTGVVTNPAPVALQDLIVQAVLRDASGTIIGGGYANLDFLPAGRETGVLALVASSVAPVSVDLYASITSDTLNPQWGSVPAGAQDLTLVKQGWGTSADGAQGGYGFVVTNPNTDKEILDARFQIIAYDAGGYVLDVETAPVSRLLPGETYGVGGFIVLPAGAMLDRVEVQAMTGVYADAAGAPAALSTADATYVSSGDYPVVTGAVLNGRDTELTNVDVSAIAYDAAGNVIGGGFVLLDNPVPAGSQAAVEVQIVAQGEPASVELYATTSE